MLVCSCVRSMFVCEFLFQNNAYSLILVFSLMVIIHVYVTTDPSYDTVMASSFGD